MFPFYQTVKYRISAIVSALLLTASLQLVAQDRITTAEISEPRGNKFTFRTQDSMAKMGTTERPYTLFGTDFNGSGGFFITFNLETRQTVRYQLVDMMGKEVASQDLREVLDQTYRVQGNNISSGAYIVRLMIDHKCYTDKIFFTP